MVKFAVLLLCYKVLIQYRPAKRQHVVGYFMLCRALWIFTCNYHQDSLNALICIFAMHCAGGGGNFAEL